MPFIRLESAPVREPISASSEGKSYGLYSRWFPWFDRLVAVINALCPSVGLDVGDANITLTSKSARTQIFNTPLTAPRTITIETAVFYNGEYFEVVRTAAATGASGLDVGGLKTLAAGEWCVVRISDSGWMLVQAGTL